MSNCAFTSKHPATPLAVSISDVAQAGGSAVTGLPALDALASYLESRRRLDLLELDEACKFLRVGQSKLYDMVRRKRVPYVRLGRKILFARSQLEDWVMKNSSPALDSSCIGGIAL